MTPILFRPGETNFNSNGLGLLYDCIDATCTEARNGEYEISLTYPVDGLHYSDIQTSCLIMAIPSDGESAQLFRIYYISKPSKGKVNVKAEHISYQLCHIPVSPYTATSALEALQGITTNAVESCPFEFWSDNTTVGSFSLDVPVSARSVLGGMRGSILDVYNGEYKFDNYLVRLYAHRGTDRGVTLRYGKNITDIKQEENIASTITGVMPYWAGQDAEGTAIYVDLPEKVLHSQNAGNFPYLRSIVLDCSQHFKEQPTEAQLRAYAQSYITKTGVGIPKISIDVSFVALWQTEEYADIANLERVKLCDTVTVDFEPLGISATAKVVKTEYDILKERYKKITLGDARTNLAGSIKADIDATSEDILNLTVSPSFMQAAIARATNLIRGGLGGYVVFTPNADGEPQELLFMDSDDIQTAVNVIRINKNGIGFSNDGYDPTKFVSAWTIDGKFSADFIAAGTMLANYIKGGTLSLGGSNNGNGVIAVYNASGTKIGQWDNSGLSASGDLIVKNGYYTAQFTDVTYPVMALGVGITWETTKGYSVDAKGISQNLLSGKYIAPQTNGSMYEVEISTNRHVCSNKYVCIDGTNRNVGVMFTWAYQNSSNCVTLTRVGLDGTNYQTLIGINYTSSSNSATMSVSGKQLAFVSSSARRYKHAVKPIKDSELDPHKLLDLTVVQFEWNDDHNLQYEDMRGKVIPGIIAEDVEEIYPAATIHDENGNVESWDERRILPGMLALIQEQDKKIKELEARLAKLEEALCRVQ